MSQMWQRLQFKYASRHGLVGKSKNWQTWLIKYIVNQAHALWGMRNRKRHGEDKRATYRASLDQARRDVTAMYSLQSRVLTRDRDLFGTSLDRHLQQPLSQLLNWLSVNKELILMGSQSAV